MLYVFLFALLAGFLSWCVSQIANNIGLPAWLVFTLYQATLVLTFWYFLTIGSPLFKH